MELRKEMLPVILLITIREVNVNVMTKNTGNFAHRVNLKIDDYKEKS